MKDYDKEGNLLVMQELYEAYTYFYMGNKAVGLLANNSESAKRHYVKQDLGNKFMYNCKNYGIKFKQVFDLVFDVEVINYEIDENRNEIITSRLCFTYDYMNDNVINYNYLYTPYSTLINKEEVKVLFKQC